jgi:hypothetical protein
VVEPAGAHAVDLERHPVLVAEHVLRHLADRVGRQRPQRVGLLDRHLVRDTPSRIPRSSTPAGPALEDRLCALPRTGSPGPARWWSATRSARVHEVGTNDCAARWKIQSGFTFSSVSRVEVASRRSHSSSVMLSAKCSMFSVRLRLRWMSPKDLAIPAAFPVIVIRRRCCRQKEPVSPGLQDYDAMGGGFGRGGGGGVVAPAGGVLSRQVRAGSG